MSKLGSIKKENIAFIGDFNIKTSQWEKVFQKDMYKGTTFEAAKLLKKYDMKLLKTCRMTSIKTLSGLIKSFIRNGYDITKTFKEATASTINSKGKLTKNLYDHTVISKKTKGFGVIHDDFIKKYGNFSQISDHLPVTYILKFNPTKIKGQMKTKNLLHAKR